MRAASWLEPRDGARRQGRYDLCDMGGSADSELSSTTKSAGRLRLNRTPGWAFSRCTLELIRKSGFQYDSSAMGMDEPYELMSNGQATGMVESPVDWILDDYPYFISSGALPSPELIFKVYQDEFDRAYKEGTMLMLTMHPMISDHRSRSSISTNSSPI
jgi:peptidoglycan/xylan/chitin deacetylase (PgdA/CDA1 family)